MALPIEELPFVVAVDVHATLVRFDEEEIVAGESTTEIFDRMQARRENLSFRILVSIENC